MGQTAIYKLIPRGAFHFGERGIGVEETADLLHSDTLFSALVSAWRALGRELRPLDNDLSLLEPFAAGRPPFRISSAFPYAGEVLLFPCPLIPLRKAKSLKKVAFVSEGALRFLARDDTPDTSERKRRELIQDGHIWVTPEERDSIKRLLLARESSPKKRSQMVADFDRDARNIRVWSGSADPPAPHVAVDRVSSTSNLFFAGRLRFAPGFGLYFWVDFADPGYRSHLEDALMFLQDEGIGGRRSTGHGQFTSQREERALPTMEGANGFLTLSLYRPHENEVKKGVLRDAWYRRIHRRGWIYSPDGKNLRRKGLWMLREGTVLCQDVLGTMEDLHPEVGFVHPVWRYGYALTMRLRLEGCCERDRDELPVGD